MFSIIPQMEVIWVMMTTAVYTANWRTKLPNGGILRESSASRKGRWTLLRCAQCSLWKLHKAGSEKCWVSGCSGPLGIDEEALVLLPGNHYELHSWRPIWDNWLNSFNNSLLLTRSKLMQSLLMLFLAEYYFCEILQISCPFVTLFLWYYNVMLLLCSLFIIKYNKYKKQ